MKGEDTVQSFECAGEDRGETNSGFSRNFAIDALQVVEGAHVRFVDKYRNVVGGNDPEALYVHTLRLEDGATVTLDGVNLYYTELINNGATIEPPDAALIRIPPCASNADCEDADPCSFDQCIDSLCIYNLNAKYGDVGGAGGVCGPDGSVGLVDILAVLNGLAGNFADGCELANINMSGDQGSCIPNETIDLSDIIAVLNAFEGLDACCADGG